LYEADGTGAFARIDFLGGCHDNCPSQRKPKNDRIAKITTINPMR
jgi:hypothetical protein